MGKQPNYSDWLTKQQAAITLGVSTKTLEKWAAAGTIQTARQKRAETGASISVYHPGDVQRVWGERNPDKGPFVVPGPAPVAETALGRVSGSAAGLAGPDAMIERLMAFARLMPARLPAVPIAQKLFLTLREAAEYTGLPGSFLRSRLQAGSLIGFKTGRGWRLRRRDLDELASVSELEFLEFLTD